MRLISLNKRVLSLLGALVLANSAFAQTIVLNNTIIDTPSGGMWVIAPTGKASFCQSVQNAGGMPQSKCVPIGNIGASAAGFAFNLAGSGLFAVSKTSGAIYSCTVVLLGGINPAGGCAQVSALSSLQ